MANTWKNVDEIRAYINTLSKSNIIAVYDLETTGLGKSDKILQFSAKKYDNQFNNLDSIDIYIKPFDEMKVNGTPASLVNGITDEMLDELGIEENLAYEKMKMFFSDCDLITGYNQKSFDSRFMKALFEKYNDKWNPDREIDVFHIAKLMIPDTEQGIIKPKLDKFKNVVKDKNGNIVMKASYKLETITKFFDKENTYQFHSAIEDVSATAFCLKSLMKIMIDYVDDVYIKEDSRKDIPKQKFTVEKINLFNPSNSIRRVYLNGDQGSIYYDDVKKEWGIKKGNIESFDMDDVWNQVKEKLNIESEFDLFKTVKELNIKD